MNAGIKTLLWSIGGSFLAAKLLTKPTAPRGIGTSPANYNAPTDPNASLLEQLLKKLSGTPANGTSPASKSGSGSGMGVGSGPSFGGLGGGNAPKPPAPGDTNFLMDPSAWQISGFLGPSAYTFQPEDPGPAVDPSSIDMSWADDPNAGDVANDPTLNSILDGLQVDPPAAYSDPNADTSADPTYSDPADTGGYAGEDPNGSDGSIYY